MRAPEYLFRIYDTRGVLIHREAHDSEHAAVDMGIRWTEVRGQKSWKAEVWHKGQRLARITNGKRMARP